MAEKKTTTTSSVSLRRRAEKTLDAQPGDAPAADVQALIRDLEIQNEELRRAQCELSTSRDRYRDLYDSAPVGCLMLDENGRILEANYTAADLLRIEPSRLVGENIATWMEQDAQDQFNLHRQEVFSGYDKQTCEVNMHRADGTPLVVRLESVAREAGSRRRCQTALIDITTVRQRWQQLEESEQRYRRLTDAVTNYIYRVRIDQGRAVETIHGANCQAVTGYTPDEFHMNPLLWIAMVPAEDRGIVEQQVNCILADQVASPIEHRIQRKDGQVRWVLNTVCPQHDQQGRLIAYDGLLRDTTKRRNAEQALRQLNDTLEQRVTEQTREVRLLAEAMANLGEGVLITTNRLEWPGPRIVYANRAMCRISGYTAEELIGQTPRVLQGEHTDENTLRRMRGELSEQRSHMCELVNYRKDGTPYDAELYISPLYDADGKHTNFIAIHRDITQRKQAEDAIRRANEFNQRLIDTAQTVVLVLDTAGRIVQFNSYLEELSGWKLEEVQGHDWFDTFVPESDRQALRHLFKRARGGERTRGNVNTIVTKDGRQREIEWHDAPLTSSEGELIGLLCTGQDITQRNAAAKALHDREEQMRAILDTAADAVVTIDHQGIIDSVNPATERMFGFTQDELIGQNVKILMPSPYCDEHDGYIARYLETGEAHIIGIGRQVVARRSDGSTFPVDLAISELDHRQLFTGIIRDVSERVEAQQKLLQAERLAAIGEAMARLAHESRNALQRSQACLDLLAEQLECRADLLDLLASIQRAQDSLHRLYEEVRAYAAPIRIRAEYRHLGEIIREAWEDVASVRIGRDASLEERAVCHDLRCEVDSFALGQVFRNILENALQACSDPVRIQVNYLDLDQAKTPSISISIHDNGPGLLHEHAQRVFQSFFTTKADGTGLGMAIAQRIVQAHGGGIAVNPDCERGAEFVVTLPRKQP